MIVAESSAYAFRRLMIAYAKLQGVPELKQESALRAELANGSRVIALPGSERTTRGYAGAKLIILDEAARVDDDLLAALRPTMATVAGSLIMLTTPFGKRGEFWRAWSEGQGWTRVSVPASACPRKDVDFSIPIFPGGIAALIRADAMGKLMAHLPTKGGARGGRSGVVQA
jgi:hypothetical protein